MKNLILHIGWPKSGTSAIQGLLANNASYLEGIGFRYPGSERLGNAHHPACGHFISHHDPLIPPTHLETAMFLDSLENPEGSLVHTTIVSSEGFCRADSISHSLTDLAGRMNVTVVACLRDPLVWSNSLMNQLLKMRLFSRRDIDFEALAEEMISRDCRYSQRLRLWADAVGTENIRVVALEEGTDFSGKFFTAIGIDRHRLPHAHIPDSSNRSVGLGALQLISWLRRNNVDLSPKRRAEVNRGLHGWPTARTANLLRPEIWDNIRRQRPRILEELGNLWLNGQACFPEMPNSLPFEDPNSLDSPDVPEIAEAVLINEPAVVSALRKDIDRARQGSPT